MNCRKAFIIVFTTMLSLAANAQVDSLECDRMKFFGSENIALRDYKTATMYFLKAEASCNEYNRADWKRLLASIKYVISEEDEPVKKNYIDTLLDVWDRQEIAGFYNEFDDLERGMYIMQSSEPEPAKADMFFRRGIKATGLQTHEAYLIYAYYTTYLLHNNASIDQKPELKTRLISDYLIYSDMVEKASWLRQTQETLDNYFAHVVQSCDDLLPSVHAYLETLPKDTTAAIKSIQQMTALIEKNKCEESDEYIALLDAWLLRDSSSLEAKYKKDPTYFDKLNPSKKIDWYDGKTTDPELKAELRYKKAYIQFKSGQYHAAYATGLNCTGNYEAKGKYIAAQCVAQLATSCGESTFDRKCNYIYAAQLAEEAGQNGAAQKYLTYAPSNSGCSVEMMQTITLDCWGVTVKYCP